MTMSADTAAQFALAPKADILLIQTLDMPGIACPELMDAALFYLRGQKLYFLDIAQADATEQEVTLPVATPVRFIFQHNNQLWLITGESHLALWRKKDSVWQLMTAWPHVLPVMYVSTPTAVFFLGQHRSGAPAPLYWLSEPNRIFRLSPDLEHPEILCISATADKLLLACKHPAVVVEADMAVLTSPGTSCAGAISLPVKKLANFLCINFVQNGSGMLLAADGVTRLTDLAGNTVFEDLTPLESGYQIAAAITVTGRKPWHILGTWRRNAEHPRVCLYVLDEKCQQRLKKQDAAKAPLVPWTGYNRACRSLAGTSAVFANSAGLPVVIRYFAAPDEFQEKYRGHVQLDYRHEDLLVASVPMADRKPRTPAQQGTKILDPAADGAVAHAHIAPRPLHAPTNVYVTIDVEQHHAGAPYCLTGDDLPSHSGVEFILDTLDKYGLKGIFFVNVYEHPHHPELIPALLRLIHGRGHEVGLHCHASSLPFNQKVLSEYGKENQLDIIRYGMDYIRDIIGIHPVAYRGGAYDISHQVMDSLQECGIKIDSSHFMAINQPLKRKTKNALTWYGNLIEIPVTTHMINNAASKIDINWSGKASNMQDLVLSCYNHGLQHIVCMLHSFSFLKFTREKTEAIVDFNFGGRRIAGVNERLKQEFADFCQFLAEAPSLMVCTFGEALARGDLDASRQWGTDIIPRQRIVDIRDYHCPVCDNGLLGFTANNDASLSCPVCGAIGIDRLASLYLHELLNINHCQGMKVLHINPSSSMSRLLKYMPHLDWYPAYTDANDKPLRLDEIPFSDEVFDLVIMHSDACKEQAELVFTEIQRILKEEGILLLLDAPIIRAGIMQDGDTPQIAYQGRVQEGEAEKAGTADAQNVRLASTGFSTSVVYPGSFGDAARFGIGAMDTVMACVKTGAACMAKGGAA